eukprot:Skav210096  [mRNA]  locus=scaffold1510:412406:414280:+ [translate_table: standard]
MDWARAPLAAYRWGLPRVDHGGTSYLEGGAARDWRMEPQALQALLLVPPVLVALTAQAVPNHERKRANVQVRDGEKQDNLACPDPFPFDLLSLQSSDLRLLQSPEPRRPPPRAALLQSGSSETSCERCNRSAPLPLQL